MTPPVVFNSFPPTRHTLTAVEPPRDRRRVAILHFRDCTAVVLRRHGGDGGATAVLVRHHGGNGGSTAVMAVPRRSHCGPTMQNYIYITMTLRITNSAFEYNNDVTYYVITRNYQWTPEILTNNLLEAGCTNKLCPFQYNLLEAGCKHKLCQSSIIV